MDSRFTRWLLVAMVVIVALWVIGTLAGSEDPDRSATTVATTVAEAPATTGPPPTAAASTAAPTSAPTTAPTTVTAPPSTTTSAPPAGPVATTRWVLAGVPVKGRAPKTGYDRSLFGPAWTDDVDVDGGRNGCDTRNDILRRDLTVTGVRAGTRDCVITSGVLDDPYTGTRIEFVRGQSTSSAVQIDHVVALSDAWQKGAQQLGPVRRRMFANDPLNLLAVDGPTNARKGDADAASWLPPNKGFRCRYVALQTHVKARYDLWMTRAEHDMVTRVLNGCTDAQVGAIG